MFISLVKGSPEEESLKSASEPRGTPASKVGAALERGNRMAKETTKMGTLGNGGSTTNAALAIPIPEGFAPIATSTRLWKPEQCREKALRGYIVGGHWDEITFKGDDKPSKYFMLHFLTDAPTLVVGADGSGTEEVPAGTEVLVVAVAGLRKLIQYAELANRSTTRNVAQCFIAVKGKVDIGNRQEKWEFTVALGTIRAKADVMPQVFKQLSEGDEESAAAALLQ